MQTSGVIVLTMILTSCICCTAFVGLCSADFGRGVRIISAIGCIIVLLVLAVYLGWVAAGTYLVLKLHSGDALCRNTVIYVVLFYVYLVILVVVGMAMIVWKIRDWVSSKKKSKPGKT